ncbi:MAG TPA: ATP-binding protein [Jiangellaceae bacterium]
MTTEQVVPIGCADDIVIAREAGRDLAGRLGFSLTDVTMIATAISEVARNMTSYAGKGELRLYVDSRNRRSVLVVEAVDQGPGIEQIERALEDGYSTSGGLGLGLPGARRLMDEFEIRSNGHGTTVVMRKWAPRGV